MLKAIKILTITVIVLFVADKLAYTVLFKMSNNVQRGQLVGKLNQFLFLNEKDPFEVVILGSSRANHHINPEFISSHGYNMGLDGQKLRFHFGVLHMLDASEQTVILHLDPEELIGAPKPFENEVMRLSLHYFDNDSIKDYIDDNSVKEKVLNHMFMTRVFNGKLFSILSNYNKMAKKNYNGYDPLVGDFCYNGDPEESLTSTRFNSEKVNIISDFIGCGIAKNKRIIIYSSPKYNDSSKEDNLQLQKLMDEFNVEYWDFTDAITNTNCRNWKDNVHLSSEGANKFNNLFKEKFENTSVNF